MILPYLYIVFFCYSFLAFAHGRAKYQPNEIVLNSTTGILKLLNNICLKKRFFCRKAGLVGNSNPFQNLNSIKENLEFSKELNLELNVEDYEFKKKNIHLLLISVDKLLTLTKKNLIYHRLLKQLEAALNHQYLSFSSAQGRLLLKEKLDIYESSGSNENMQFRLGLGASLEFASAGLKGGVGFSVATDNDKTIGVSSSWILTLFADGGPSSLLQAGAEASAAKSKTYIFLSVDELITFYERSLFPFLIAKSFKSLKWVTTNRKIKKMSKNLILNHLDLQRDLLLKGLIDKNERIVVSPPDRLYPEIAYTADLSVDTWVDAKVCPSATLSGSLGGWYSKGISKIEVPYFEHMQDLREKRLQSWKGKSLRLIVHTLRQFNPILKDSGGELLLPEVHLEKQNLKDKLKGLMAEFDIFSAHRLIAQNKHKSSKERKAARRIEKALLQARINHTKPSVSSYLRSLIFSYEILRSLMEHLKLLTAQLKAKVDHFDLRLLHLDNEVILSTAERKKLNSILVTDLNYRNLCAEVTLEGYGGSICYDHIFKDSSPYNEGHFITVDVAINSNAAADTLLFVKHLKSKVKNFSEKSDKIDILGSFVETIETSLTSGIPFYYPMEFSYENSLQTGFFNFSFAKGYRISIQFMYNYELKKWLCQFVRVLSTREIEGDASYSFYGPATLFLDWSWSKSKYLWEWIPPSGIHYLKKTWFTWWETESGDKLMDRFNESHRKCLAKMVNAGMDSTLFQKLLKQGLDQAIGRILEEGRKKSKEKVKELTNCYAVMKNSQNKFEKRSRCFTKIMKAEFEYVYRQDSDDKWRTEIE